MCFWNWTGISPRSNPPQHALLLAAPGDDEPLGRCAAAAPGTRRGPVGGDRRESRRAAGGTASPLAARLEQLLATLPEPQRAALVLRYQEDLTPEEIAATLDAPLATVKSHLQRGLKLLRAKAQNHLKEFIRNRE